MSGDAVIVQQLAAHAGVLALIELSDSPSRLTTDPLGQGVLLPALRVESVSLTDRNLLRAGVRRHVRERVQVTGYASSRGGLEALMQAVRSACADTFPLFAGLTNVTVRTNGATALFTTADGAIRMRAQDFMVTYSELRGTPVAPVPPGGRLDFSDPANSGLIVLL